jgi:predicted metalloprotease with PDZ domain
MAQHLVIKFAVLYTLLLTGIANAQNSYRYTVDLNSVPGDKLNVELLTPKMNSSSVTFALPKIIPGTYMISDYGRFVSNVKATDKAGKALPVARQGDNQWKITNAAGLYKVTYTVEDIFDTEIKHIVYPMAATDFEEGKAYVLNTPGIFGFINGYNQLPFEITIKKPQQFYGSTALKPASTTATQDVFQLKNLDELYDSPIMYTRPDTTTVQVGNAQVLVSVYSPNGKMKSKEIASWMSELLDATKNYLGGKLPVDRYAFLYYFHDATKHSFPPGLGGALEHTTSSFYYVGEGEPAQMKNMLVDISSHEFFHIITPLNISSKEVKEFNFNEAVLSKHLWLYEGVTEYTSDHVQVRYGLNTVRQFLDKLSEKITNSRTQYNDTLPFTVLSKEAAGTYKDEYGNVYEKGALIGAMLDIYLLHLSDGNYGLRNLTYDLGVRYGRDRYFNDDELFDEIAKLTYPEVKDFLVKYVAGPNPIPYADYFALAGIRFVPNAETKSMSFGGVAPAVNASGNLVVSEQSKLNDFGKALGYKFGDEIYAFNGVTLTPQNFRNVVDSLKRVSKEGAPFEVRIGRRNAEGKVEPMTLSGKVTMVSIMEVNKLEVMPTPGRKQELVRKAWLTPTRSVDAAREYKANPADVSSISSVIKATYEVISGPAGARDWNRFHSLFLPDAKMGANVPSPAGTTAFRSFTPQEYQKNNGPFFMQNGFFEEALGSNITQYGNIAHVQSAYQFRFAPGGKIEQRGVNYFTLVNSGGRWWIANLVWQNEDSQHPIPAALLK